jgi:hypothetical protein
LPRSGQRPNGLVAYYHRRRQLRERQRRSGTQPRQVGRQPGPQPPRTCTMLGAACAATPCANGVAFAVPVAIAATLTTPITASVANFILLLPQNLSPAYATP